MRAIEILRGHLWEIRGIRLNFKKTTVQAMRGNIRYSFRYSFWEYPRNTGVDIGQLRER